jgi:hypothetical protein
MTTKAFGEEGFRWFVGVVEDRDDPKKEGRVKVRAHSIHGTPIEAPTKDLPWAPVLMPGYSASLKQVGASSTGLQVGSTVFGFFLDGEETTLPIVFGVLPGIGDISKLASGQNTLNREKVGPEPESAYNAKYPYNKVFQSESGHVIEIDDTPNFERLHTSHRSGTYSEIDHSGRRVNKIVGDDFEIVQRDKTVFIQGNLNIQVQGDVVITSPNVSINGNLNVSGTVTGAGIGLSTHSHADPQGGTVGSPQG